MFKLYGIMSYSRDFNYYLLFLKKLLINKIKILI